MHRSPWGPRVHLGLSLLLSASALHAQLVPTDPDWREVDAPPPASLNTSGLIPLEVPRSTLRFGVDPASVSLAGDGIVRYVVVATSTTGVVNAIYEGIRCDSGEVKVYARHNPGSGWTVVKDAEWRDLRDSASARHSLLIARNGACMGHGANRSASDIVRDLRASPDKRFSPQ